MIPKPDAVFISPEFANQFGRPQLTAAVQDLLGGVTHFGKDGHTGWIFGRCDPTQKRMHPKASDLAGVERYDWYATTAHDWTIGRKVAPEDAPLGGMLLGYLAGTFTPEEPVAHAVE